MLSSDVPGPPVVLIIPGSGPPDRDGNSPNGLRASTYRLLAEGLAAHGISTVRVDKRGLFGSRAAVSDPNAVTIADYTADVRTWVSVIRERMGALRVWVLGTAKARLLRSLLLSIRRISVDSFWSRPPGRRLGQVLREQLRSNPANAPILDQALSAIDDLEAGRRVDAMTMDPARLPLFRPEVQVFLISAFALDPAKVIAKCRLPILIMQGQRDLQVAVGDADLLKRVNPITKVVLLPDTNHMLKTVTSDDRAEKIATYRNPDLPLSPGVIGPVASFFRTP